MEDIFTSMMKTDWFKHKHLLISFFQWCMFGKCARDDRAPEASGRTNFAINSLNDTIRYM